MCGICGIIHGPGRGVPDLSVLKKMIGRLSHRGPDSIGYYRDRRAALGHARLSIIDIEGGGQPLSNENGNLWITFNGEIFNYIELRDELVSLGHIMRTRSDTEVILHAWEEWGEACFPRLNGQWAVGIWDAGRRKLLLSRDRLGIRPLFYSSAGGRLLFGSEVKALFADPDVPRKIDAPGLAEVFTFWCPVAPRTVFSGVSELRPGHFLELDAETFSLKERPYWMVDFPRKGEESVPGGESCEEFLSRRMREASRLRFTRSDVPVGAYLSGGLDSSVTSAIVAGETDVPLTTFSLRFSDNEFDEGSFQKAMADRLGTEHREVLATRGMIAEVFPEVVRHTERPILRTAPAPLYILSRLVRENGYKVVVTGEGSDEVLAGYDIFRELKVRLFLSRDLSSKSRPAVLERLYPWMERSPAKTPAFARAFFSGNFDTGDPAMSHRTRWDTTRALIPLLAHGLYEEVLAAPVEEELLSRLPAHHIEWDPVARAQWLEMTTILPGYILSSQGDRMLMAHSVEGRFPFLDCNVVDFAAGLPMRKKLFALDEKHILKNAFGHLVPPEILRRPKQPYRAPDAASFFGAGRCEWMEDLLSPESVTSAGIFRISAVEKLMEKCRKVSGVGMSNTDNMRLVGVISTMLLHKRFIEGDGGPGGEEIQPRPETVIDRL